MCRANNRCQKPSHLGSRLCWKFAFHSFSVGCEVVRLSGVVQDASGSAGGHNRADRFPVCLWFKLTPVFLLAALIQDHFPVTAVSI